ncbi:tRNA (guanosine(46)-N7)-methyltransferase TrmB [Parvibaculum sp.]|uniref:tRNA (guanosine(46)-N7)-methyltransferase TrmB n=1 Tax=Parvibaculum sp. TaxID=2024848 RepID=UPI001B233AA8|nr:tRNA (guanosine(46)-N7)-methyltransferase TrmB [Parvibaculum sp.]MBO6634341.1 tRNA (guanosine(46)-N7)-methyltransferase TrmB [Parvibaculum sp.]MBO6677557.1 tRNA (guanosine(46)-N7)-methyltransferase TrmB [Parvibaculum sp.]MBO6685350.1 tRNA (guanosine(46)-N7)-methyltransferase TrmB [Parvibaculum sp.]MBO6905218.1 tRNA (guanosine(46)-N7)-methyltransferase TrmB [Parvibaculum sp.]
MSGERETSRRHVYGRTKGKALRPRQANLMETLYPGVSISLGEGLLDPHALFGDVDEVWLEIGFGGGEHLAHQAVAHPRVGIMGCEPFLNGVAKLVSEIDVRGLSNVRILNDDARFLLERLPPAALSRVFILYPDPWPKKRHNKRRFINEETLGFLAAALKTGGELRFASDIPDYVAWTLAHIDRFNREHGKTFVWTAERAADWRTPYDGWPGTRYEAKAIREGRRPAYLTFRRACPDSQKSAI